MVSLEDKINELEERIKRNKEALIELDEIFYKFNGPAGYPTGTSWQDYDCIRGGNKEMDLFTYVTDRERLKTFDHSLRYNYLLPVLPNPPRSLFPSNSTFSNSNLGCTSIILNCAILSPFLIKVPY